IASASAAASARPTPSSTPAGTPSSQPSASEAVAADPLLLVELVDVRDGSKLTLGELAAEGPLIVETMAIWCSNCRQQQHEVVAAHGLAQFGSVSIDVDPTEIADDLTAYAAREGFDWPFVLADAELANLLRDRFGAGVLNPPGMPKLLVRPDGTIELLPLGDLLAAEEIAAIVGG
ncbi:MAG: peroxiredoxin family protein, partial [Candidatus Limnocylindria bacterium]